MWRDWCNLALKVFTGTIPVGRRRSSYLFGAQSRVDIISSMSSGSEGEATEIMHPGDLGEHSAISHTHIYTTPPNKTHITITVGTVSNQFSLVSCRVHDNASSAAERGSGVVTESLLSGLAAEEGTVSGIVKNLQQTMQMTLKPARCHE